MKRVIVAALIAICLLSTTKTYAQYEPVTIGVKAGVNFADLTEEFSTRLKYQLGITIDYAVTKNVYILSGIDFSVKGGKKPMVKSIEGVSAGDGRVNLYTSPMYLEVPMHVAFKLDLGRDARLVLHTGPYVAIGVGGKSKLNYNSGGGKHSVEYNYFDKARRIDLGYGIGAGVEVGKTVVNLGYDFGGLTMKQLDNSKAKNRNVALTIGYKFF